MLIEQADAIAPEIELKALLEGQAPSDSNIERVIVMTPNYLKELSIILAATDKSVLQNYFVWKAVQSFSSYVDAEAVKPYKRFVNVLAGKVCSTSSNFSQPNYHYPHTHDLGRVETPVWFV
jgi:endothelin-converting enzyme